MKSVAIFREINWPCAVQYGMTDSGLFVGGFLYVTLASFHEFTAASHRVLTGAILALAALWLLTHIFHIQRLRRWAFAAEDAGKYPCVRRYLLTAAASIPFFLLFYVLWGVGCQAVL